MIPRIAETLSETHILQRHNIIVNIYFGVREAVQNILAITTIWTAKR